MYVIKCITKFVSLAHGEACLLSYCEEQSKYPQKPPVQPADWILGHMSASWNPGRTDEGQET